jgi:hypothetical protein
MKDLLEEPLVHACDVWEIPFEFRAEAVQRCHAYRSTQLRGTEDVSEYRQEEVQLGDPDSVNGFLGWGIEETFENRVCCVLPTSGIEKWFWVDMKGRNPNRAGEYACETFAEMRHNGRDNRTDGHQLDLPRLRHNSSPTRQVFQFCTCASCCIA